VDGLGSVRAVTDGLMYLRGRSIGVRQVMTILCRTYGVPVSREVPPRCRMVYPFHQERPGVGDKETP
jgi:hypothetical protein